MKPDKGGLAIILASKAKKSKKSDFGPGEGERAVGESDVGEEDSDDMEDGKMAAAEDMLAAMKSGDAKAMKDALQDFVEMCY